MKTNSVQHTPGPWRTFGCEIGKSKRHLLATLYAQAGNSVSMGAEVTKANAELIAAAPDLLSALDSLFQEYKEMLVIHGIKYDESQAWKLARAAITKAKGTL